MIIWVDLETTGLRPIDYILEAAFIVTDDDLNQLDVKHFLRPIKPFPNPEPFAFKMHQDNGLFAEIAEASSDPRGWPSDSKVDSNILAWLMQFGGKGEMPFGGSSVHFDRRMLATWMPGVEAFAHYRNIDISTIKTCGRLWAPGANLPEPESAHRALSDITHTLVLAQHYRDNLYRKAYPNDAGTTDPAAA